MMALRPFLVVAFYLARQKWTYARAWLRDALDG